MRSWPLRHKWFAWFTATVTSGSIGDEIMRLALPLLVLDLTHDIGAAAILRVIESVPYVLFGAFAGALIDRSEKRRLLAVTLDRGEPRRSPSGLLLDVQNPAQVRIEHIPYDFSGELSHASPIGCPNCRVAVRCCVCQRRRWP